MKITLEQLESLSTEELRDIIPDDIEQQMESLHTYTKTFNKGMRLRYKTTQGTLYLNSGYELDYRETRIIEV